MKPQNTSIRPDPTIGRPGKRPELAPPRYEGGQFLSPSGKPCADVVLPGAVFPYSRHFVVDQTQDRVFIADVVPEGIRTDMPQGSVEVKAQSYPLRSPSQKDLDAFKAAKDNLRELGNEGTHRWVYDDKSHSAFRVEKGVVDQVVHLRAGVIPRERRPDEPMPLYDAGPIGRPGTPELNPSAGAHVPSGSFKVEE